MVPRLRVLVAVALDREVRVGDQELDMAGALLELVVDGVRLVFGDVVVDAEVRFLGAGELRVELVGDHFVGAALEGEEFALQDGRGGLSIYIFEWKIERCVRADVKTDYTNVWKGN